MLAPAVMSPVTDPFADTSAIPPPALTGPDTSPVANTPYTSPAASTVPVKSPGGASGNSPQVEYHPDQVYPYPPAYTRPTSRPAVIAADTPPLP